MYINIPTTYIIESTKVFTKYKMNVVRDHPLQGIISFITQEFRGNYL